MNIYNSKNDFDKTFQVNTEQIYSTYYTET